MAPTAAADPAAIRPVAPGDLTALEAVIAATGLFPPELLGDMLAGYLDQSADELWLAAVADGPIALAYCAPERMTDGTWNLYLIAVHPDRQGQGWGTTLLARVEEILATRGQRILLVETSGLPAFEATRAFYERRGFAEEARIRDFYQAGEAKVIFRKPLGVGA